MRALKRERYGKKELERLKKMLETDTENVEHVDVPMKDRSTLEPTKGKGNLRAIIVCALTRPIYFSSRRHHG